MLATKLYKILNRFLFGFCLFICLLEISNDKKFTELCEIMLCSASGFADSYFDGT